MVVLTWAVLPGVALSRSALSALVGTCAGNHCDGSFQLPSAEIQLATRLYSPDLPAPVIPSKWVAMAWGWS